MCTVTNARQGLEEETLLEPHVAYSQPSSVSTTAMMDTPLTTQTCIHQTATPPTPPKPLSSFLLSLTMAQVQPRNPRKLVLPRSQPSPGNPQQWGHKLVYTCPSFPPFSEHHWEAFCILLSRRETCCLEQQPPKKALFVFASSFLILLTPSLLSDP